jgi:hypothetical protein
VDGVHGLLNGPDNGHGREFARLWILAGGVLKVQAHEAELALDLDVMAVACEAGHSDDFEGGAIRADASEADGGGNVEIRGEARASVSGGAEEDLGLLGKPPEIDVVVDDVRSAVQGGGPFTGDHGDVVYVTHGRGLDAVESDDGTGWHEEAAAGFTGTSHDLRVRNESSYADEHEVFASVEGGSGKLLHDMPTCGLDDEVRGGDEVWLAHERPGMLESCEEFARGRFGSSGDPGDGDVDEAIVGSFQDGFANRPAANDSDACGHVLSFILPSNTPMVAERLLVGADRGDLLVAPISDLVVI